MNERVRFRRALSSDASIVRELTREAYAKWVRVIGREPGPMLADYSLVVNEHQVELLEEDGELQGLIELIPYDKYLLIENVAVAPKVQGRGIGARLLERAEEVALSKGLVELRLYTNKAFRENISYYYKHGYREYDRGPIKTGGTVIHMKKRAGYA